jgi:carbon-monoxide dehydrogenase small subunit
MKSAVEVTINGETRSGEAEPRQSLADFVREACGLTGTHLGCEHGVCGACTVLLDGKPVRSCLVLAVQAGNGTVETVEGFAGDPVMERLRQAFSEHHALQCGFCTPGMLITARDIVVRLGVVDEERVRQELSGNICRCTGYEGIVRAIKQVASENIVRPSKPVALTRPPRSVGKVVLPPKAKLSAPPAAPMAAAGDAITVEQHFETSHPLDKVWTFFADPNAVAACLPGAELVAVNGENISGRVQIKMGPIRRSLPVTFAICATIEARSGASKAVV